MRRASALAAAAAWVAAGLAAPAHAEPERYRIDSEHTYPSLEFPHMGISTWRGKFTKSRGYVVLDRAARSGSVDVTVQAASIDFGHRAMNDAAIGPEWLNAEMHPTLRYVGEIRFEGEAPAAVDGKLTLLGITHPVALRIGAFRCIRHPFFRREVCGADASGTLDRARFGMKEFTADGAGIITLRIQVEALKEE
jgi:polyisoprenoid-binding protein YceI